MKRSIILAFAGVLLFAVAGSAGDAAAFDFEREGPSSPCLLGSGRDAVAADKEAGFKKENRGGVETHVLAFSNGARSGAVIRCPAGHGDAIFGPLGQLTLSLAFRSDPVVATPCYFQRINGSSTRPGFLRFNSQNNSGDELERKGTFRFTVTDADGKNHTAASTAPWEARHGEWHRVAVVFDKGNVRFYLDGELWGNPVAIPLEVIPESEARPESIRAGFGFSGAIDDLVIAPGRALSGREIKQLHEEGPAAPEVRAFLKR